MRKLIFTTILIAGALAIPLIGAHSQETYSQDDLQAEAEAAFRQADIINDGRIDEGEFDMYHQHAFRVLDYNKDGKMTMDECVGGCFMPREGDSAAVPSGTVYYKFETIDLDGSGEIAEREYILYARERFADFDTDQNGTIDISEFCAFYRESMPCTFTAATKEMMEKQ